MLMLCHDWGSDRRVWSAMIDVVYFPAMKHNRLVILRTHFARPQHLRPGSRTNLDIVSYSAAAKPASNENLIRAFSVPF